MTAETTGTYTPNKAGVASTQRHRSLGVLIAISIFWFALNFHWAALLTILVPSQVTGLLFHAAPGATLVDRKAWVDAHVEITQALVEAPGLIVALIANPLFGLFSDRTPGRLGRRRPYILGGTALNVVGLVLMALAPLAFVQQGSGSIVGPSILVLTGALMLTQLANNAAAAPFHALLPDMVPEAQRGKASGIMGLALFLGQIGGAVAPILFGFDSSKLLAGGQAPAIFDHGIVLAYFAVAGVIALMALLTLLTVREDPWRRMVEAAAQRIENRRMGRDLSVTVLVVVVVSAGMIALFNSSLGGAGVNGDSFNVVELVAVLLASYGAARAFDFRPRRNPDFSWVVVTRMLVMMGVYTVQNFIEQYMRKVAIPNSGGDAFVPSPEAATTLFIVILTVTALISTLLAGWGSDRIGRKRMVYISGGFMAVVGAAFVVAPYLVPGHVLTLAFGAAAVFGIGYGAYVSVDWALVADVLPSEKTFARDMGVWNIGLTAPQVIALVFGSWLVALGTAISGATLGYTFLFVWLVVFCILGTVTVRNIKGVNG
ncbi:MAG: MFS transporter [Ktedonobacterales bacterium]